MKLFDNVNYASRGPSTIKDLNGNDIVVYDTFPYNPESKTTGTTVLEWASRSRYYDKKQEEPVIVHRVNVPFFVTIVDLEHRCEGGRAYKVIDDGNRQFDLREDQILEVFRLSGLQAGGRVNGRFVWGTAGSQTKMVLVGGELYNEMKEETEKAKQLIVNRKLGVAPRTNTLQVGHVYKKHDQSCHLYIGKVFVGDDNKPMYAFVQIPVEPTSYASIELDGIEGSGWSQRSKDAIVWYKGVHWNDVAVRERCEKLFYEYEYNCTFLSSPKFDEEVVDLVDVDYATEIRENKYFKFGYKNGLNDDLVDKYCNERNIHRSYYRKYQCQYSSWRSYGDEVNCFSSDNPGDVSSRANAREQYMQQLRWVTK